MVEKKSEQKITSSEKCAKSEFTTMLNGRTIELSVVRNRLETLQASVLHDIQKRMSDVIDEVMKSNKFHSIAATQVQQNHYNHRLNSNTRSNHVKTTDEDKYNLEMSNKIVNGLSGDLVLANGENNKKKLPKKHHILPDKIFVTRDSFLTANLEVEHMKNIFVITLLLFLLNRISYKYYAKVSFGLDGIKAGFAQIDQVAVIWLLQHIFVFGIFYALKSWSHVRNKLVKHETLKHFWSISCLAVYIATQVAFIYVPNKICLHLNLPFVTACVLLLETVRLLMKMHSFVRTVTARVLKGKLKTDENTANEVHFPQFKKYLYYLFAPTLLYRDEYPRTSTIRWKFALNRLLEVVAVAFLYNYIYERHLGYHFKNIGNEEINAVSITMKLFDILMPVTIIFFSGFYMILHAWLNFTAELLCFGDRMFYRDWWTASNYEAFFRNWNVVVHDWIYEYLYKDFYNHIFKGSKILSSLVVFFISALFHEIILSYALQTVFPVMFIFFGVLGVVMIFLTRYAPKHWGNMLVLSTLVFGFCTMFFLYVLEYFARLNCPKELNWWTYYLVPHVWSCYYK